MPTLYVIAGPNGCGKSTLTRMSGFTGIDIIDPDAIARGLGSGKHVQAAREALRRRRDALGAGRTHLVETTLAGSTILRHIATAQRKDYWIVLHFVSVGLARPSAGPHSQPGCPRRSRCSGGRCEAAVRAVARQFTRGDLVGGCRPALRQR